MLDIKDDLEKPLHADIAGITERISSYKTEAKELEKRYSELRKEALFHCQFLCEKFHFSEEDLSFLHKESKIRKVKPKFKNPFGDETWTGRGRKPLWFTEALQSGLDITDLKI